MLKDSAFENKTIYNKDEALIRMIALGITMKIEKGNQYYCYKDGVFYVSSTLDFKEFREWNTNDSSQISSWIRI